MIQVKFGTAMFLLKYSKPHAGLLKYYFEQDLEHLVEPNEDKGEDLDEELQDEMDDEQQDEEQDDDQVPSPKHSKHINKGKLSSAHKYKTKFNPEWPKKCLFIIAVPNDPYRVCL